MNIEHLNRICPELIEDAEDAWREGNWDVWAMTHCEEIIVGLQAALRLKKELSSMGERE